MRRWLTIIAAVVAMTVIVAWELCLFSDAVGDPDDQQNADYKYRAAHCLLVLVRSPLAWLDDIVEGHHDAVIAIATIAVAIFTCTLWWATKRLWETSQLHASHMERSVIAAEKAATFLAQTERAVVFDVYVDDNVRQEQGRFHRARQGGPGVVGEPFGSLRLRTEYRLKNYGKTPAFLGDIEHNIIIADPIPEDAEYRQNMHVLPERVLAGDGGETTTISCERSFERALGGIAHDAFIEHREIWFVGRATYRDISGASHEHAFVYRYSRRQRRFVPVEHPRHTRDT